MRIVLDTNCLIQSVGYHSQFRPVLNSILCGENVLCVSNEIIEEYTEILQRLFSSEFADTFIKALLESRFVELITPYYHFNLIKTDPDDNKFVDCAIAANARYVVTNDRHFDILKQIQFPHVTIISLMDFLNQITNR